MVYLWLSCRTPSCLTPQTDLKSKISPRLSAKTLDIILASLSIDSYVLKKCREKVFLPSFIING